MSHTISSIFSQSSFFLFFFFSTKSIFPPFNIKLIYILS
jgi:hypothetical protein